MVFVRFSDSCPTDINDSTGMQTMLHGFSKMTIFKIIKARYYVLEAGITNVDFKYTHRSQANTDKAPRQN